MGFGVGALRGHKAQYLGRGPVQYCMWAFFRCKDLRPNMVIDKYSRPVWARVYNCVDDIRVWHPPCGIQQTGWSGVECLCLHVISLALSLSLSLSIHLAWRLHSVPHVQLLGPAHIELSLFLVRVLVVYCTLYRTTYTLARQF